MSYIFGGVVLLDEIHFARESFAGGGCFLLFYEFHAATLDELDDLVH